MKFSPSSQRLNLEKFHVVVERIMQALFRAWASPLKCLNQVSSSIKKEKRYPKKRSEVFPI